VFAWAVLITQSYCSACELRAAYSGHAGRFGRCAGPRGPHPQYVDPPNDHHHWRIIATASVDRHCAQPPQLICAKPAVVIFLIYVVWVSFKTGFTLGPHSASAHNVWGLARTSAAEQDRSTTGISSHAGKRAHPGGHFRQHAYSLWTEIGYVQCFSCELDEALTRASTNLASLIIHLCSFDCLRSCPSPNHRFPAATARRGSRRVVCEVADPIDPLCKPVLPAIHADLAARSTRDHLLTDPMIGSCMIAAPPGVPVFIDTRLGFCGSDFSTETLDALAVQPDWKNFLDRYAINIAVLDRSRRLAQAFAVDSRFSLLYGNHEAVVVRRLP
jgi:hypothetical protein